MKLKFEIETISYISCDFILPNGQDKIHICHSGLYEDKFQELISQFYIIYNLSKKNDLLGFPRSFEMVWKDDFVYYKWIVNIESPNSHFKIKIIEQYPTNPNYKKILLDNEISFDNLYDSVYFSLHQMIINFGFIGYKYNWDIGNFPIGEYLLLKADKYGKKMESAPLVSQDDEWKHKITLEDEMDLLKIVTS